MATINTSKISGSSLDVASIVSQLMEIERKPLAAITAKIERSQVKISSLGAFQSKLSALKDAVDKLQTPTNFTANTVTSSNSAVLTAQQGTGVVAGQYEVTVNKLATNAVVNLSSAALGPMKTYTFQAAGVDRTLTVAVPTGTSSAELQAHYEELRNAVNTDSELRQRFTAVLVDGGGGQWGVSIQGLATGLTNSIALTGASNPGGTVRVNNVIYVNEGLATAEAIKTANFRAARDATFAINGSSYTRGSNSVDVSGLKMELLTEGASNVEVRQSNLSSEEAVKKLATTYNDVLSEQKKLTASNVDANLRGVFNSDSSLNSIMRQITGQLSGSLSYSGGSLSGIAKLGLELADNGQMSYKPALITDSAQLQTALSRGVYLGSGSTNNLSTAISDTLALGGMLSDRINAEKTAQSDLSKRQATVQDKMAKMQERYTAQYAALDALLFKLNNTNAALKSALDALSNRNNK